MVKIGVSTTSADSVGDAVRDGYRDGLRDAVAAGFERSQEEVPVDTGELKDSGEIVDTGDTITFRYTADHAIPVEAGTSPHTIEGNPLLAFIWEDPPQAVSDMFPQARDAGGRFASGRQAILPEVEHPGTDPQPYIQPGFREMALWLRKRGLSPAIAAELGRSIR